MAPQSRPGIVTIAAAFALVASCPARADTLLVPAPGATNIAVGGSWLAWSAPTGDGRHRLVLRAGDGTVRDADTPTFSAPVDPSIGHRFVGGRRMLVIVYSREDASGDADIAAYDLQTHTEELVRGLSSPAYDETAPSFSAGTYTFVRSNGRDNGVLTRTETGARGPSGTRRIVSTVARETASNHSSVAYSTRASITIRRLSGFGRPLRIPTAEPRSLVLSTYHAAWLSGDEAFRTNRLAGSGLPSRLEVRAAGRSLPTNTDSIAAGRSLSSVLLLDAEGVKVARPPLWP